MSEQMLRHVLKKLTEENKLEVCSVPVDRKYEIGAVLSYYKSQKPILFKNVINSKVPVIGGLYGNRDIVYDLWGVPAEKRFSRIINSIAHPVKPVFTDHAPVQENVITENIDLPAIFPIPTYNALDSAPFLTSGIFAYKDPESNHIYAAIRRIQVNGGNSVNVLVSPASPYMLEVLRYYQKIEKDLECAVILGADASLMLTSQISSSKYRIDKYEIDSAMRGEPLELVNCKTIDLAVPSQSEIILEGVIHPHKVSKEGPFAELMGCYSPQMDAPLMELTALTYRNDAIFQQCFPGREEHLIYGIIKEAEIYQALKSVVDVQDINLTVGGGHRLHAVVSIHKRNDGDAKSAILTTLGAYKDIKLVIVTDEDVNIYDPDDVEYAVASRFQADNDLILIKNALGSPLDPSYHEKGLCDKIGLDATKPLKNKNEYERAQIPPLEKTFDILNYIN